MASSRASSLPQGSVPNGDFSVIPDPVGAGLARDEAGTASDTSENVRR